VQAIAGKEGQMTEDKQESVKELSLKAIEKQFLAGMRAGLKAARTAIDAAYDCGVEAGKRQAK
jgi:hypothetical protein